MESLANRYAMALFALAFEDNDVEGYQKDAKDISASLKDDPKMSILLSSYFITQAEKDKAIDKVYGGLKHSYARDFVKTVCRNGRANMLGRFLDEFIKLCNEYRGIAAGVVYSAKRLSSEQIKDIQNAVSRNQGIRAELRNEVDGSLIGGVKVVIEDKVFDGSVKNTIESLRSSLMQGGGNQ